MRSFKPFRQSRYRRCQPTPRRFGGSPLAGHRRMRPLFHPGRPLIGFGRRYGLVASHTSQISIWINIARRVRDPTCCSMWPAPSGMHSAFLLGYPFFRNKTFSKITGVCFVQRARLQKIAGFQTSGNARRVRTWCVFYEFFLHQYLKCNKSL